MKSQATSRRIRMQSPKTIPGSEPSAHRRFFYVERSTPGTLQTVLSGIMQHALTAGMTSGALLEERATLVLPNGTALQGISFKREHSQMELFIRQFAEKAQLTFGELVGEVFHLGNTEVIPLQSCTATLY